MTILSKNHPFIIMARKLEMLEAREGISDEVLKVRIKLKEKYPQFFAEYMGAKKKKEGVRFAKEKIVKKIQIRERGCETVSFWKKKKEEQKRKNRNL